MQTKDIRVSDLCMLAYTNYSCQQFGFYNSLNCKYTQTHTHTHTTDTVAFKRYFVQGALYKYVHMMIIKYRNTISSRVLFTFNTRNLDIIMMKTKLKRG